MDQLSWSSEHVQAYEDLKTQLREAVKLAHWITEKPICIYTDASDAPWAAVVTQCDPASLKLPMEKQMHEPLAFLGSAFNTTQQHWSTFDKEAYSIFQAFERMDYMLICENDIHLFTDHRNLLFVFNPLAMRPSLGRHIVNKVQRWALFISRFMYTIEHVEGKRNITADMLTRWYVGSRNNRVMSRCITKLLLSQDIVGSTCDDAFSWVSSSMIQQAQSNCHEKPVLSRKIWKDYCELVKRSGFQIMQLSYS